MRTASPFRVLRPLLLVATLGLLAGACSGDGQLGGPTVGGTPAATIGDHSVSNADLAEEAESWAESPAMLEAIGLSEVGDEGRRSTDLVAFVLSHRVVSEQARLMLAEARDASSSGAIDLAASGVSGEALGEPGEDEIDAMVEELDAGFTGPDGRSVFAELDEAFRRRLARDLVYQQRLQAVLQLGVGAPAVEVNPRYGTAEILQGGIAQVVPPTGPLPAPGGPANPFAGADAR